MLIDLQVHSTCSDGYLKPKELALFLAKQGVKTAALTDHNTVSGLEEFRRACRQNKIKAINGLELYARLNHRRFNLLWYNFDSSNPELHEILRESQLRRRFRFRRILESLVGRGFKLKIDKTLDKFPHYIPINRVIDELLAVKSNQQKIIKELRTQSPREEDILRALFRNPQIGVLRESYIDINRIMRLRRKCGGQLILCHPAKYHNINKEFFAKLKQIGIDGIEVLSPHHSLGSVMFLQAIAKEFGFITTGGSDFHRFEGRRHAIQYSGQYFTVDSELLKRANKIIS